MSQAAELIPVTPRDGDFARREVRVSYELHRAVASHVLTDHERVVSIAYRNLDRAAARTRNAYVHGWITDWREAIDRAPLDLVQFMLAVSERANDLRQMTPFAGVLSQQERLDAIARAA